MAQRDSTTELLAHYLRPHARRVALLSVLLLVSTGLPLIGPQLMRAFIDTARAGGAVGTLVRLALVYIAIGLAQEAVAVWRSFMSEQVGWATTNTLREDLARHALGLDMSFHNTHTPGEMIERVDGDVTALSHFFSQFVVSIIGSVLYGIGILALTWREDWRVGVVLTAFSIFSVVLMTKLRKASVPAATEQRESSAHLFGFLEERLQGTDDIRANAAGHHVMRGFALASRHWLDRMVRSEKVGILIWVASIVLFGSSIVMTLAMGAWLYSRGQITLGTVFLLFQYVMMLDHPISNIAAQFKEFQKAGAGIVRIRDLRAEQSRITSGTETLPDGPLTVAFEDVTFSYGSDEAVLSDVSFALAGGETLGVVGRTGSGKTTLTRLLLRLYDTEHGAVRVGDADVRDLELAALRRRVGVVTQDVQLFQGTVRDNLTLFDDSVPDERIREVLADVGLVEWYLSLADGLDTELASGGGGLSAGEAQLVAFARVFLRDPGLVILDEASSRLDPATEALIEDATSRLLAGRTAIVIAHRLQTVERADKVLVMDDGRVAEFGPRSELARDPASRYARLAAHGLEEVRS